MLLKPAGSLLYLHDGSKSSGRMVAVVTAMECKDFFLERNERNPAAMGPRYFPKRFSCSIAEGNVLRDKFLF